MEELPELPEPTAIRMRLVDDGPEIIVARAYSADQMRSYALAAVLKERERCARIAEDTFDGSADRWDSACECVAAAIREKGK
jgi:hypothetical protein